jgi:hypothetical protein
LVKIAEMPELEPQEARALINSIDARSRAGLRDRACIVLMVHFFAHIGAALSIKIASVFTHNHRKVKRSGFRQRFCSFCRTI